MTHSQRDLTSLTASRVLLGDEAATVSERAWSPFDDRVLAFLVDLSRLVTTDSRARHLPDVVSLGYWCRKSSLNTMRSLYPSDTLMMGRGLAFHVPPANVPLNFAYSLICGLLAGNTNIVRLSTTISNEQDTFVDLLAETLRLPAHQEVSRRICLVRYGHDDEVTLYYSLLADARVIWGGDKTVTHIRGMRSKPRAVDISFVDRVSLALVNAQRVAELTDDMLASSAAGFVADSYTFDQNACSSPKMVVWQGSNSVIDVARSRFWPAVEKIAAERDSAPPIKYVNRFVELCETIALTNSVSSLEGLGSSAVRIALRDAKQWGAAAGLRFGTFSEVHIPNVGDLDTFIDDRVQTVSYLGYEPSDLRSTLSDFALACVDRVVPFGQALSFDLVWDGYDLIRFLSRRVMVR